jgi:hypothetical protein
MYPTERREPVDAGTVLGASTACSHAGGGRDLDLHAGRMHAVVVNNILLWGGCMHGEQRLIT